MRNFQKVILIISTILLTANLIISCIILSNSRTTKENINSENPISTGEDIKQIKREATTLDLGSGWKTSIDNNTGKISIMLIGAEEIHDAILKITLYDASNNLLTTKAIFIPHIDTRSYINKTIDVSSTTAQNTSFINITLVDGYVKLEK